MSLERYTLKYKLKKTGGFRTICGRSGKDFYLSLVVAIFYLTFIRYNIRFLEWWSNYEPSLPFALSPIAILAALIFGIQKQRNDVIYNSTFSKKLDNNDFLASVEFFYDFPVRVALASIIIWIMFVIMLFINSEIDDAMMTDEFVAYIFAVPIFFIMYSILNFYYCMVSTELYKGLEIKYAKGK